MTWSNEQGRQLPPEWPAIVRAVKARAKASSPLGIEQCEARLPKTGKRCPDRGVDVDHMGHQDDHRLVMLKLKCEHHHDWKTARQGHAAWAAKKKKAKRPPEEHPGRRLG